MNALTISAASGMKARLESLEMLANNIANQSTAGFKPDREVFSLYVSAEAQAASQAGGHPLPTTLPVVEGRWTDFSQGTLTATGNPLHLGLSGKGFFAVQGPGGTLYTRNGNFRIAAGGQLQTQEGYAVLDPEGRPLQADAARPVEVSADGVLRQQGEEIGRLAVVDFSRPQALGKRGGAYFQLTDLNVKPTAAAAELHQGKLEAASFSASEAAIRLVSILRQFEILQKAITIGGEMNRRAVEEVARVGS